MIQLNDTENFKVIIAEHDLSNENDCAYAVGVEEIIAHPAYNNTSFDGDFSIVGRFWGLPCLKNWTMKQPKYFKWSGFLYR